MDSPCFMSGLSTTPQRLLKNSKIFLTLWTRASEHDLLCLLAQLALKSHNIFHAQFIQTFFMLSLYKTFFQAQFIQNFLMLI